MRPAAAAGRPGLPQGPGQPRTPADHAAVRPRGRTVGQPGRRTRQASASPRPPSNSPCSAAAASSPPAAPSKEVLYRGDRDGVARILGDLRDYLRFCC
ncbi:hypothetical protein ACFSTC_25820 [Nonomuraea ferruginea]